MDKILCWNVRGLNNINKQKDVQQSIQKLNFGVVSLIETKIKNHNMDKLY